MPDEKFESIDDIEKHYGKLRKGAKGEEDEEAKVREFGIEEREAKADFRDRASAQREVEAHRKTILADVKWPEEFKAEVVGDSVEALDKRFKTVEAMFKKTQSDDTEAQKLYGAPASGGGTPPGPRSSEDEKWIGDFQSRFNDEAGTFSVGEVKKYAEMLGGAHLLHNLSETSRIFRRNGITPELVAEHEKGTLKQARPSKSGVSVAPRG